MLAAAPAMANLPLAMSRIVPIVAPNVLGLSALSPLSSVVSTPPLVRHRP